MHNGYKTTWLITVVSWGYYKAKCQLTYFTKGTKSCWSKGRQIVAVLQLPFNNLSMFTVWNGQSLLFTHKYTTWFTRDSLRRKVNNLSVLLEDEIPSSSLLICIKLHSDTVASCLDLFLPKSFVRMCCDVLQPGKSFLKMQCQIEKTFTRCGWGNQIYHMLPVCNVEGKLRFRFWNLLHIVSTKNWTFTESVDSNSSLTVGPIIRHLIEVVAS